MAQIHCRRSWSGSLPTKSPRSLATGQEDGEREYEKAHEKIREKAHEKIHEKAHEKYTHFTATSAWKGCVLLLLTFS